uniref:Uncharacterized protein n=1 Tax=Plectus sambesii TaxID=2011161 RepID=A0A914UQE2_9BILA
MAIVSQKDQIMYREESINSQLLQRDTIRLFVFIDWASTPPPLLGFMVEVNDDGEWAASSSCLLQKVYKKVRYTTSGAAHAAVRFGRRTTASRLRANGRGERCFAAHLLLDNSADKAVAVSRPLTGQADGDLRRLTESPASRQPPGAVGRRIRQSPLRPSLHTVHAAAQRRLRRYSAH